MADEFIRWWTAVVKKIAFIVEGQTEKILIESIQFKDWIKTFNLELITPVVNAAGGGNLLPHNIGDMIKTLKNKKPDHIFILTDLERAPYISTVKDTLFHPDIYDSFITVVALESWFLACTSALLKWLNTEHKFSIIYPEDTTLDKPFERIRKIGLEIRQRGTSNKVALARDMIKYHGFSFEEIYRHPNCSSIKYIAKVLRSINTP